MRTLSKFRRELAIGRGFAVRVVNAAPPPGAACASFPRPVQNKPAMESGGVEGSVPGDPEATASGWTSVSGRRRQRRMVRSVEMNGEVEGPEGGHRQNVVVNTVRDLDDGRLENLVGNTICCGSGGKCDQHESKKNRLADHLVCATLMDFGSVVGSVEPKWQQQQVGRRVAQRYGRECTGAGVCGWWFGELGRPCWQTLVARRLE